MVVLVLLSRICELVVVQHETLLHLLHIQAFMLQWISRAGGGLLSQSVVL